MEQTVEAMISYRVHHIFDRVKNELLEEVKNCIESQQNLQTRFLSKKQACIYLSCGSSYLDILIKDNPSIKIKHGAKFVRIDRLALDNIMLGQRADEIVKNALL